MTELKAQMAGTVFEVSVKEGEEVTVGQTVIILESMKMEIPVEAERAGRITKIYVVEGDFVDEESLLVRID
ncbi:biotin/lipoyl-binding carrier protein [Lysinibacillus sp. 54212]|uniref:biotin/lipoyl-binding carrier protein n=1 Tax=Lysinibacillus sp. 54212 TaxID=3119829 RepID=UPI002FCC5299